MDKPRRLKMFPTGKTWSFSVMEKCHSKETISGEWENKGIKMMYEERASEDKLEASWLFNYGSLSWDKCVFPSLKSQLQPCFSQDGNPFEKDDIKAAQLSPQGTSIIQSLNSVLNEQRGKFLHEFNPENLLNHRGEFARVSVLSLPLAGTHDLFREIYLGEDLACMALFLIVSAPLSVFTLIWPSGTTTCLLNLLQLSYFT